MSKRLSLQEMTLFFIWSKKMIHFALLAIKTEWWWKWLWWHNPGRVSPTFHSNNKLHSIQILIQIVKENLKVDVCNVFFVQKGFPARFDLLSWWSQKRINFTGGICCHTGGEGFAEWALYQDLINLNSLPSTEEIAGIRMKTSPSIKCTHYFGWNNNFDRQATKKIIILATPRPI